MKNQIHMKTNGRWRLSKSSFLFAGLLMGAVAAHSDDSQPECAVYLAVSEVGKPDPGPDAYLLHEDTVIVLDRDKSVDVRLHVINRGQTDRFDVSIESARGLQVASGGGIRQVTVKPGERGVLPVTIRGNAVEGDCRWDKRMLRVSVKPRGAPEAQVCGYLEKGFFCPDK